MANYSKSTNFATKDSLLTGDPLKVIKGTEIDDEFEALETAISTKANSASPTFTGTPTAPTASTGTNTTQIATTAFVQAQIDADIAAIDLTDSIGANEIVDNSVGADELNVSGDGTAGQFLISDGDGSFSWTAISVLSATTTDPTTRDDGSALAEGDQYYNTTDDVTKAYDGSAWNTVGNTYGVKAWVKASDTTISGSGNVSSVTGSTGSYTINFTTAMDSANYAVTAGGRRSGLSEPIYGGALTYTTTSTSILLGQSGFTSMTGDPWSAIIAG